VLRTREHRRMITVSQAPPAPALAPAPAPDRDVVAVTAALRQLDAAVAQAEQAAQVPVPGKGLFGGGRDAHDAAVAKRRELLEPAAAAIRGAADVLNANGGYRAQPRGSDYLSPPPGGYAVPFAYLGDNGEDMVSIGDRAAANPIKHTWANDFPWQSQPTTSLEDMVDLVRNHAATVTRGEARISLAKVTELAGDLLYERRAAELEVPQLQRLNDVVGAVRQLGDSRFADDALRSELARLPEQVLVDGRLTADPASLEALERLHRATVVDAGSTAAAAGVAARLEQARQLAEAGDTAGARAIYESLGASAA
jgi:hypothetical protein